MSTDKYFHKLDAALADDNHPFQYTAVRSYHTHPLLIEALARRVTSGLTPDTHVIFSAHSLPQRIIDAGDPYDRQLHETAALVAAQAGVPADRWSFCYQSAGRSPEPWLGPDLKDHLRALAAQGKTRFWSVVVGFVCDHVEVLFDIDIQAQAVARELGVTLNRAPSLNDDPLFIDALVDIIHQKEAAFA